MYGLGSQSGVSGSGHLYRIDNYSTAPSAVDIGATTVNLATVNLLGLAIASTGTAYGISSGSNNLYQVNLATGSLTFVGNTGTNAGLNGLGASGNALYATAFNNTDLFKINPITGAAMPVIDTGYDLSDVTSDPTDSNALFAATLDNKLIKINVATSTVSLIGSLAVNAPGIDFAPNGNLYAVGDTDNLGNGPIKVYQVNKTNAIETLTGVIAQGSQFGNVDIAIAPVPEASTTISFGLLLALGLGCMIIAARKKA